MIAAIRAGEIPPFADDLERVVFEANVQLLRSAALTHETREEAIELLGYRGVTELIATVTLYVVTAYTTNVARVKLADDFSADPERLKDEVGDLLFVLARSVNRSAGLADVPWKSDK